MTRDSRFVWWGRRVLIVGATVGVVLVSEADGGRLGVRVAMVLALAVLLVVASRVPGLAGGGEARSRVEDQWRRVVGELERARRHARPLVLARIPLSGDIDATSAPPLEREVLQLLRATDVAWVDRDDLMVLMPEVSMATAQPGLDRITSALGDRVRVSHARVVCFPDDGVTLGALCDSLSERPPRRRLLSRQAPTLDDVMENAS